MAHPRSHKVRLYLQSVLPATASLLSSEFKFILCLKVHQCPDPNPSLWGLMLIHIIRNHIKLFYLLIIQGEESRMCVVVC